MCFLVSCGARKVDPAAEIASAEAALTEERYDDAAEAARRAEDAVVKSGSTAPDAVKARAKAAYLAGRALRELGRLGEAEAAARRSVDAMPSNPASRGLLGSILAAEGKHAEALPHIDAALAGAAAAGHAIGVEQLHYQAARSLSALGREAEAREHWKAHETLRRERDAEARRSRAAESAALARSARPAAPPRNEPPPPPPAGSGSAEFVDRARDAGVDFRHDSGARGGLLLFETMGGGAAWMDHDQDGDPDLYLVCDQPMSADGSFPTVGKNRLYRNDGGRFNDVTAAAGAPGRGYGMGAAAGDLDGDGFPELLVTCFGQNVLYRNRRDGTFAEAAHSGVEGGAAFHASALFADFDADGRLDVFVASYVRYDPLRPERCFEKDLRTGAAVPIYCGPVTFEGAPDALYRNDGELRFRDVTRESGIGLGADARSKSLGALAADFDEDGDVDLFVACDTTANLLYRNRGGGVFDEVGLEAGVAASDTGAYEGSMGVAYGDADGDHLGDILVTNFDQESNRLYLAAPRQGKDAARMLFEDGTARTGIGLGSRPFVGWGAGFFDAGCDGRLDLFVADGHIYHNAEVWLPGGAYRQRNLLYALEGARWRERGLEAGPAFSARGAYRGAAFADYDLDGAVDIVVVALDAAPLLLHAEGKRGHWLEVDLRGSGPGGTDAVGAKVEATTRAGTQVRWRFGGGSYLSASEGRLHFGLGGEDVVERLAVTWPGGTRTVLEDVKADRRVEVRKDGAGAR